jgi:hypothetical protein
MRTYLAFDPDRAVEPHVAGPVADLPAADEQVEHAAPSGSRHCLELGS